MANVITGNPLILDTAADNIIAAGTKVMISKIKFFPTDKDQTCQIEDAAEVVKSKQTTTDIGTATNAILPEPESDFDPPLYCDGLSLGVLTAGSVHIYLARPLRGV